MKIILRKQRVFPISYDLICCSYPMISKRNLNRYIQAYISNLLVSKQLADGSETKCFKLHHMSSGQPFLCNSKLNVSISHVSGMVISVVSKRPVGVDIEVIKREQSRLLCLTRQEQTVVKEDLSGCFTKLWTMKEAVFKCVNSLNSIWDVEIIKVKNNKCEAKIKHLGTCCFKFESFSVSDSLVTIVFD